jgi:hypothetical protein
MRIETSARSLPLAAGVRNSQFLQYIYVTFRKTYSMASVLSILRTHFHVEQPPLETGEGDDPKHDPLDIGWERRATEAAS